MATIRESLATAPEVPLAATNPGYRPDIDGLRALAVISVILFHAGLSGAAGGFTGVDMFFVISGYLIGGHIFREVAGRRFSFADFYARRIRRILPALLVLIGTFQLIGLVVLTPAELRQLGREGFASVLGLANLYFYTGNGYFSPASERHPLLMTWSLGVEEQFYLLFPFVMLGVMRFRQSALAPMVAGLSILSFVGSVLLLPLDPSGAFYLLPPRAWELGVGVLLALWEARRTQPIVPGRASEIAGVVAVALLAASILLYQPEYAFPGLFALLPVLGAALLIATPHSAVSRHIFAQPAAAFIGRISYSLYLWHWPVFYLNRIMADPGKGLHPAVLIAICFALGYLSWKYVEQPWRRPVLPKRTLLIRYAAIVGLVAASGIALDRMNGIPARLAPAAEASARDAVDAREDPCLAPYGATAPTSPEICAPPLRDGQTVSIALLGDSHASALAPGVRDAATQAGMGFVEFTKSSCLPLFDYAREAPGRALHLGQCVDYQAHVLKWLEQHPEVRVVMLAGYWANGDTTLDRAGKSLPMAAALELTVQRLETMGREVVLVLDAPSFRFDPYARLIGDTMPVRAAGSAAVGAPPLPDATAPATLVMPDPSRSQVSHVAHALPRRRLIDPYRALCSLDGCRYGKDGTLYYFDFQHLTGAGARAVVAGTHLTAGLRDVAARQKGR